MNTYIVLLRGINVGGKNKLPMVALKSCLEELGFQNVATFIASGNVIVQSPLSSAEVKTVIEDCLPQKFTLNSTHIKVLVLTEPELRGVIERKPAGFGDQPDIYHSDVIFLMDIDIKDAMPVFQPRESIDKIWPGHGVIYSQRLSAERTKSRLSKIIGTLPYQSMTIRTWNTAKKLLELAQDLSLKAS